MPDANTLEILIRLIADTTGATLTADQVDMVKQKITEMGGDAENAFQKAGDGSERFSFRTQHHAQMAILAMTGLQSPLTNIAYHFEYLKIMADRTGQSVGDMLLQFAPMIAVVAVIGAVGKAFQILGDDGKKASEDIGVSSDTWVHNFEHGIGLLETLNGALEKTDSLSKRIADNFEHLKNRIDEAIEAQGEFTNLQHVEKEKSDIEKRTERTLGSLESQRKDLEDQAGKVDNLGGQDLANAYTGATGKTLLVTPSFDDGIYTNEIRAKLTAALSEQMQAIDIQIAQERRLQQTQLEGIVAKAAAARAADEEQKARLAELAGDAKKAADIRAAVRQAQLEGVDVGGNRYKEIVAGLEGANKKDADAAKAADAKDRDSERQAEQQQRIDDQTAAARRKDAIAAQEAIIDEPTSSPEAVYAAKRKKTDLEEEGVSPGEKALLEAKYDKDKWAEVERGFAADQKNADAAAKAIDAANKERQKADEQNIRLHQEAARQAAEMQRRLAEVEKQLHNNRDQHH